ncbi:hypothetical protein CP49_21960 [Bradyrhizobium valentinum]|uniref:Uncharacterized protein n=1 Tax=Bradyrhizobium valentinum TaxID=1518501 RepID=A0A0R3LYT7_9BRAD|nr:hypothetical protein CP49_21960 [Bradyrhizobium valentinum]
MNVCPPDIANQFHVWQMAEAIHGVQRRLINISLWHPCHAEFDGRKFLGDSKQQWQVLKIAEDTKPGDISAFCARQRSGRVLCYDNGIMKDVYRLAWKKRGQFFALILILTEKCGCSMPSPRIS